MPGAPTARRRSRHRLSAVVVATAAALIALLQPVGDTRPSSAGATVAGATVAVAPVVVELFTSQGCSSCPPADRLLGRLAAESGEGGPVVPLSFHVDYWNDIGWTDPFSSPEWSRRQSEYARAFGSGRIYTPQVLVNGSVELVGSNEARLREEIEKARRLPAAGRLTLDLRPGPDPGRLELEIAARVERAAGAGVRWSVMVAVVEDDLETPVARGENGGRTLRNTRVVRSLAEALSLPARPGAEHTGRHVIELEEGWKRPALGVAVFLQDPESRRIHGAAAASLPRS